MLCTMKALDTTLVTPGETELNTASGNAHMGWKSLTSIRHHPARQAHLCENEEQPPHPLKRSPSSVKDQKCYANRQSLPRQPES